MQRSASRRRMWLCSFCGRFFYRTVIFRPWGKRTARCTRCGSFDTEPLVPLGLPWGNPA